MNIIIYILVAFIGYTIGRIGHIVGGQLKAPHHWIYGFILMVVGLIFYKSQWGLYVLAFGFGLFISDLKDFLAMKFYGVDDVQVKKFWHVD